MMELSCTQKQIYPKIHSPSGKLPWKPELYHSPTPGIIAESIIAATTLGSWANRLLGIIEDTSITSARIIAVLFN